MSKYGGLDVRFSLPCFLVVLFFISLFHCFSIFYSGPCWKLILTFDPDTEIYIGPTKRSFVPIEERTPSAEGPKPISHSGWVSLSFLDGEMVVIATDWLTVCMMRVVASTLPHTHIIEFRRERCLQRSRGRNCKTVGSGDFARGSHEFYVPYRTCVFFFLSPNQMKSLPDQANFRSPDPDARKQVGKQDYLRWKSAKQG